MVTGVVDPQHYSVIACLALAHCKDFFCANKDQFGKRLILNNCSSADGLFLFSSLAWGGDTEVSGAGFFVSFSSLAGCCPILSDMELIT